MNAEYLAECPEILRNFFMYLSAVKGRSDNTLNSYFLDLRGFLRFYKAKRDGLDPASVDFSEISILDITAEDMRRMTLSDAYEFLYYEKSVYNIAAATRARKVAAIRQFFKYLEVKAGILNTNPMKELDSPVLRKSLPVHLSLEESIDLLSHVSGKNSARDYCMLTLFLNCGMRLSELVGINCSSFSENTLKLLGKGNKERIVYLNDACLSAVEDYRKVRSSLYHPKPMEDAFFLSTRGKRIDNRRVQQIVEETLQKANLSGKGYSTHKLRHTAATLLYQHGNVDIRVLQELLGHANLGTTQIYTHVSSSQLENAVKSSPLARISPQKKAKKKPESAKKPDKE